ncbi:MAG TPA: TetR/AcrR family transcriptional regulator [Thermoanaerobaculia bacterium]|jgi:AcrR family transcriptional regulator
MGRHKTISDEEVLRVARKAFRTGGFAVSGREIARLAGVSEAVLYQRFESKDALFFAAMAPTEPDLAELLGPRGSEGDAHAWVRGAVERMTTYFEDLIPLAIQVLVHPDRKKGSSREGGPALTKLEKEFSNRLRSLQQRGEIAPGRPQAIARLLTALAHDWALHNAFLSHRPRLDRASLAACVEIVWRGLAPGRPAAKR